MEKAGEKELLLKLGEHLRALRTLKGYTLEELANEADIELSQVYRIEKGKINPKYTTLCIIAKALNLEVSELLRF